MSHVNDGHADTQNKNKKNKTYLWIQKENVILVICLILWLFSVLYKMQNHNNFFF